MKKKNRIKKGIAALLTGVLTFSMTAGIMPGNVLRVQAADTGSKPETVYYATKGELMDGTFAPDENGKAKKIAKLQFGNRKDGTRWLSQKWYILGADSGVQGDNTVLFAAEPMVIGSQFNSDGRDRNYKTESGTYQNGNPTTVSANHYGASELRASMQAMVQSSYSEEETYFTREEKRLLQKTTVTTTDIKNQKDYTTSDELYALKGDVGETVLRAGSRDDKVLAMDPYWQDGNYYSFWLRSASDSGKKPAVNIARMQSQVGYCDQINASYTGTYAIRPAANLNLTEALFASTAETSNGTALDLSKYYYDAMTLRLDGKAKGMDIGTVEYNPAQGLIKAKKGTIGNQYDNPYGGMYWEDSYGDSYYHVSLVVQGGDDANPWCYSEYIEGLEYVDVDDIQKELTEKNITTEPVDLSKCKIWLETTGWYYKLTYAVEATETTEDLETKISKLNVWDIDAPVAGEALDTSCEIYTSGLTTGNPVVTWTPNHTTAEYDTAYTTSVTLEAKKHYIFTDSVFNNANISEKKAKVTKNPDGTLTLTYTFPKTASNTPAEPEHRHCICGQETADANVLHNHSTATNWTGISSLDEIRTGGDYYLKNDINLTDAWEMNVDGYVFLCLNGHTITGADGKDVIVNEQSLVITDCHSGSEVGKITHKPGETGRGIHNEGRNASLTMYNGCITGNTAAAGNGGGVWNENAFMMLGGSITGNSATKEAEYNGYGGGVYNCGYGTDVTCQIKGNAVISNNSASNGGGICNFNTLLIDRRATVKDNNAVNGGGVWNGGSAADTRFIMSGDSSITGNTATYGGGGVYTCEGYFGMEGNAQIASNSVSDGSGGGVFHSGDMFSMDGGSITENTGGGGIYVNSRNAVRLSGKVTITGNKATTGGSTRDANYHQESNHVIEADGLVEGSRIGIEVSYERYPGTKPTIMTNQGCKPEYFSSDSKNCAIVLYENAVALSEIKSPEISSQPQDAAVKAGEKATFTVEATGTDLTYQWQIDRNDGTGFVNIEGATSASYTTGETDATCNGFAYRCVISNSRDYVTTFEAKLTVEDITPPPAKTYEIIATAGANGSISPSGTVAVTEGEPQTFTITAAEGYEIDTLKVDGATVTVASSYTFEHVTAAHTIEVTFRAIPPEKDKLTSITAPAGITVANNTAYADMNLPAQVNIVTEKNTVSQAAVTWDTSTPASGSYDPAVLTEQTVTLNGTVTCPEELDANGVALTTSITITISAAGIVGAPEVSVVEGSYTENQTVTLISTTEDAKIYYTTDGSAPELVNGTPAGMTKEYNGPISITGTQGQEVKTTVRAIAIKQGMQNSEEKTFTYTIAIPNLTPDPNPAPVVKAPVISTQPQAATVKVGEKATFTVTVTGEAMTYQWQIDRQDGKGFVYITGADKESYVSSVVDKDCNGFMYRCIISNAGGSVTTDAVTLTVTSDPAPAPDPTQTPDPSPMPAPQYSILEGANSTWTQGTDGSLVIRGDGEVTKFLDVKVDGAIVDKANYTVIAGSTIVTFKPDYMQTLAVGSHTFEMIWSDGAAETNFTVTGKAPDASVDTGSKPAQVTDNNKNVTEAKEGNQTSDAPRTGDPVDVVLYAILLLASLAGVVGMLRRRK